MKKVPPYTYSFLCVLLCGLLFIILTSRLSKYEPIPAAPTPSAATLDQESNSLPDEEILDGAPEDLPENP